jgi:multidrug efflux system outer membrane protein
MMKAFAPALLALALSACAVGPDYKAPESEPARLASADAAKVDRARFESLWWQQFDDPTLNQLVQQSLQENRELRIAFARLKAARAIRDDVGNDQLPVVTAGAAAEIGKGQQPGITEERVNSERYDLGLDMAWELDLFGRIQRQIEASDAEIGVAEADLQQLQVSLIAELVDAYGNLRGAQLRERIARDNLKNQQESRGLTEQLPTPASVANSTCCAPMAAWLPPRPACRNCRPKKPAPATASPPCSASVRNSSPWTSRPSRCR